uniref:Methyltransferase FkbM domain-containing protein n=1 Tax=viral metagenome TaxID=1070528 RepID=A0A6C0KK08_9ZZZZ
MSKVFFQIGTNNGNDLFREMVIKNAPDCVILVEPNKELIDEIIKNYNNIKNVYIYNYAIYYNDDETVELYIPAKNGIIGTRADNGIVYTDGNFSLLPMNDWGNKNDMVKMTSKSITFDKICSNHNITNIDYLQIDTEGFDSEIIQMIDLSKYKINKIRFESWYFKTECYTTYYEEKSVDLGINGMNKCINKLKQHNYVINNIIDSDGNDIIATLNV